MPILIDSYPESNLDTPAYLYSGGIIQEGQSFLTSDSLTLDRCKFYIYKAGNPTGDVVAKVYAHTGTYGSTGTPTGSALATSDVISAATVPTSWTLVEFVFSSANRITLDASTHYVLLLEFAGGNVASAIGTSLDTSSPTHGGNRVYSSNGTSWTAHSGHDQVFYVYGVSGTDHTQDLDDTFTLSDNNAGHAAGYTKSLGDTFTLSDGAVTDQPVAHQRSLSDSFSLGDAIIPDHHDSSIALTIADFIFLSDLQMSLRLDPVVIPPVFSIQPNGGSTMVHGYLTDVIGPAEDGHEQRVQLRAVPVHGVEYEWMDLGSREAQLLASFLYRAEEEWVVPFWPHFTRATVAVAEDGGKVYVPTGWWATSPLALWATEAAAGALYVVLWTNAWTCEARRYTGHGSDGGGEYLTVADGPWPWPVRTVVVPATLGRLVGDVPRERLGPALKSGKLALRSRGVV